MKVAFKDFKLTIERNLGSLSHILLHGSNQSEIKEMCDEAAQLLCGPAGHEEMRINKLPESSVLKDPGKLETLLKTVSFFPGRQVLIIEGATDKISNPLTNVLQNWTIEDTIIILMSNTIKPSSSLRKMVESNPSSISTAVYEEQRNITKIEERINFAQFKIIDKDVSIFLKNPSNFSSMQTFILFIEKLEAYKFLDQSPVTLKDIDLLLTDQSNLNEFEMLTRLANGDIENMIELLRKLLASGLKPNRLINAANKHFVLLHKLSLSRYDPNIVLNKNYPPLFGPRRYQVIKQSEKWSTHMIERALDTITELERRLRTSPQIELNSLLERSFLRICSLRKVLN